MWTLSWKICFTVDTWTWTQNGLWESTLRINSPCLKHGGYCRENHLTHVGEADGRRAGQTRSFGQLIFLKSIGQAAQVVFALFIQAQPQVNLYLGLDCPPSRPETFLSRDLKGGKNHLMLGKQQHNWRWKQSFLRHSRLSAVMTHPQKQSFDFATVLSSLLVSVGKQDVFGRNSCISNPLAIAYHPYEDVGNAVLRLWREGPLALDGETKLRNDMRMKSLQLLLHLPGSAALWGSCEPAWFYLSRCFSSPVTSWL